MQGKDIEKIEIDLFLETVYQRYGYDFRHYAKASVRRRVRHLLSKTPYARISEMVPRLLYDEDFAQSTIYDFSITVTEMFRDPGFYRSVRENVIPYLWTYPFIKVWLAGCATGEEVYSLAILLKEEGLYDRATIFAREGIYSLRDMRQYTVNYQKTGGQRSFSEYYHAQYESAIMEPSLKKNITFANHNLTTDGVFGEMHLIFCRNVLIYFDRTLQNRVLNLLVDSLTRGGFLCLGAKETPQFSEVQEQLKVIDTRERIYQRHIG
jgi:chemotaxis protein methyltransferase CheR